jgi:hypothetical protein
MAITITNLRVDYRESESPVPWPNVKYAIVNCVFRCAKDLENHDFAWHQAKGGSEEYHKVLTIDDPKRYEDWLVDPDGWSFSSRYNGYGKAWTHADPVWSYIEKFDCFHFREWVADCSVTRAIIAELEYYKEHGKLPSVYRSVDDGIILSHLRSLHTYWD